MDIEKLSWRSFINDNFTDCIINFKANDIDGKYKLHKVILSKNKWFRSLFTKENSNEYNIEIPFNAQTFNEIINFIYNGYFSFTKYTNYVDLFIASNYLKLHTEYIIKILHYIIKSILKSKTMNEVYQLKPIFLSSDVFMVYKKKLFYLFGDLLKDNEILQLMYNELKYPFLRYYSSIQNNIIFLSSNDPILEHGSLHFIMEEVKVITDYNVDTYFTIKAINHGYTQPSLKIHLYEYALNNIKTVKKINLNKLQGKKLISPVISRLPLSDNTNRFHIIFKAKNISKQKYNVFKQCIIELI